MDGGLPVRFVMVPEDEWNALIATQQEILARVTELSNRHVTNGIQRNYIPALEFMEAVGIEKSLFFELQGSGKLHTIKRRRKTYVLASEVQRYFNDPAFR